MSGFYNDEHKISFDRADYLVYRYLRRHCETRETVTVLDICRVMDVEHCKHNAIRIRDSLDRYCLSKVDTGNRERFAVPEEMPFYV